ncbi:hypothetical protein DSO57_1032600 [Entomophthora muscae]|uniref:Uncharacterized protein n=1 Tax=Entomophthora muscae TaxID=34485 RepID=A0ACC2UB61_9FUNG|nr:hypothetical protein DSO57_1032600 [Entomophthora muscae]
MQLPTFPSTPVPIPSRTTLFPERIPTIITATPTTSRNPFPTDSAALKNPPDQTSKEPTPTRVPTQEG